MNYYSSHGFRKHLWQFHTFCNKKATPPRGEDVFSMLRPGTSHACLHSRGPLDLVRRPTPKVAGAKQKHTIRGVFTYIWLVFKVNVDKDNDLLFDWTVCVMVGKKWKQSFQCKTNSGKQPQHGRRWKMPNFNRKNDQFLSGGLYMPGIFSSESNKTSFLGAYCTPEWNECFPNDHFGMMTPVNITLWD